MTAEVDVDARTKAYKALTVIFILAIAIVNFLLAIQTLRRGRLLSNARSFIVMTLTGGDIFIAMFPLVTMARLHYDGYQDCEHYIISKLYLVWFLPFVYGFALITLCVELIYRENIRSKVSNPSLQSLLLAGIPWILALVIILPMGLAGFQSTDRNQCEFEDPDFTQNRTRACFVVGAILPSILAVIATYSTSELLAPPKQDEENPVDADNDDKKEQQTLLMVALANAALTLPFSFFMVNNADDLDPVPLEVISQLCLWLLLLRSVVVPLIWYKRTILNS